MATATITYEATYKRWRRHLARVRNIPENTVFSDDDMRTKHKFTNAGLRALTPGLNELYADVELRLVPSDMDAVTTVGSVARLIFSRIPAKHQA